MVFLDEDCVEQPDAVVHGTARLRRVLLGEPEPRDGLARVEHAAARALEPLGVAPRCRGRARQRLQEIERGALAREQRPGRALEPAHDRACGHGVAVPRGPVDGDAVVERGEDGVEPLPAAEHGVLAQRDRGAGPLPGRDERGGDVAIPHVLLERARHGRQAVFF